MNGFAGGGILVYPMLKCHGGDTDIKNYAKYILKDGSVSEKQELLANLRSKIVYKDKKPKLLID